MVRVNEDLDNHSHLQNPEGGGFRNDDRVLSEGMSEFSSLHHLRSSLCADRDRLFGDHQVHQAVEEWREFFGRITP